MDMSEVRQRCKKYFSTGSAKSVCRRQPELMGEALGLRIVSIFIVAAVSALASMLPFTIQDLRPTTTVQPAQIMTNLKCLAAGVILSVGFVHVLPNAAHSLAKVTHYPLAYVIAMIGSFTVLAVEKAISYALSHRQNSLEVVRRAYQRSPLPGSHSFYTSPPEEAIAETKRIHPIGAAHADHCGAAIAATSHQSILLAYIMEFGILFHSFIIGAGLGVQQNLEVIRILIVALCVHQFFEGLGLATCIIEANLRKKKRIFMLLGFTFTTSVGIASGIGISKIYDSESLSATLTEGVLNALAAGILIHLALVDLIAEEFNGHAKKGRTSLFSQMFCSLFTGAFVMNVVAIWA